VSTTSRFLIFGVSFFFGCSSPSATPLATGTDAAQTSDAALAEAAAVDAAQVTDASLTDGVTSLQDDAAGDGEGGLDSSSDASPPEGGGPFDAGGDPNAPNPPTGFVACGGASFSNTEAIAACNATAEYPMMSTPYPRACGSVETSGGEWAMWCQNPDSSNAQLYLYVRFENFGYASTPSCPSTMSAPLVLAGNASVELHPQGAMSNAGEQLTPRNGPSMVSTTKITFALDGVFSAPFATAGTGNVWLPIDSQCPPPDNEFQSIVTGAPVSW